jgi:hypothetical protein
MMRWQGISTCASFVRANRLAACPRDRQARLSLLMMYSELWLPIRFKAFRAAATACSSIEVLCSWWILCDGTLSENAMTIPLKGFGWLGSNMMMLNPSLGRDAGVQSCPLPVGAPTICRLRANAVGNGSPQIHRKGFSEQSCSRVVERVFVSCCCSCLWYSGFPRVHVGLVIVQLCAF